MKLKSGDLVIILGIVILAFVLIGNNIKDSAAQNNDIGKVLVTNFATGEEYEFELGNNASYVLDGFLGDITITVEDGRAQISHSSCPDQLCVTVFGWISTSKELSVCMPNQMMLKVEPLESGEGGK